MKTPIDSKGHETTDAEIKPLVILGAGLVLMALVVVVLSRELLVALDARAERADAAAEPLAWPSEPPAGPHLQSDPQAEMRAFRAAQEARISGYDWVDRDAGIVQVPVARALELVAQRGLPVREPAEGDER